jgi:Fic-DOC domain mobile mystery protein B
MPIEFSYPDGATPLTAEEIAELIPSQLATRAQLNEWEHLGIREADEWAFSRKHKNLLSTDFMCALHKRMLGDTWGWAGRIRLIELNLGFVAPEYIRPALLDLCNDVEAQIQHHAFSVPEIAARFHHRLVHIHPFVNGNGRFGRLMTDLLLVQNGLERFDWRVDEPTARSRYLESLRAADRRDQDYRPLFDFLKIAAG